jgi:hypothetical protein
VVPAGESPVATFLVTPGTVIPKPGTYLVTRRKPLGVGGDGAKVEHVVYFGYTAETWVAFSAALDDSVKKPGRSLHTGAIRGHRADIAKIWENTVKGSTVVVIR